MCLIVFSWDNHPKYKLILAANRDEFYARPTAPANFWPDDPEIFGGRDLQAGGTWMALSNSGGFGAVTNYRDLKNIRPDATSRGEIVTNYFKRPESSERFLKGLHRNAKQYNGFNVLVSDLKSMWHYSNYEGTLNEVKPGTHGLSNALLDTPWPKLGRLKHDFDEVIGRAFTHLDLLDLLMNKETYPDNELPETGIPHELEKALSAICIRTEKYGTCSSAVLTVDREGAINFTEKTYAVGDREEKTSNFEFKINMKE